MISLDTIVNAFHAALGPITWHDCLEIMFFTILIYYFTRWLCKDTQKNLVYYFYGYCALTFVTHYIHLHLMSLSLFILAPAMICIFIILHQHTLQRNFVSLQEIHPPNSANHWIEELIRTSLHTMNKQKNLIWIIERTHHLETALEAACLFYADLKKDLIDLLLEPQHTDEDVLLWINQTGKLIANNVHWKVDAADWISPTATQLPTWQQQALLISSKTDTIIIRSCAKTRLFTLITQEKKIENLTAHHATTLLTKLIMQHTQSIEGFNHAQHQHYTPQQRHPEN